MDDFGGGEPDPDDSVFNRSWMGPAIPFVVVTAFVFCGVIIYCHRRNVRLQRSGLALNRPGNSLEDGYGVVDGQPHPNGYYANNSSYGAYAPIAPGQQQPARGTGGGWRQPWAANRWAWGGARNARTTVQTEGLDENGQAPPPYMRYGAQDKMAAEADGTGEHIELRSSDLVSAPASAHVRQSSSGREVVGEPDRMPASQTGSSLATATATSTSASASASAPASTPPSTLPPAYSDVVAPKRPN